MTNNKVLSTNYAAVHSRLRRHRGLPGEQLCHECRSSKAHEWAYTHDDPNELVGFNSASRVRYSLDLSRYVPMCRPCHRNKDKFAASGWRENGHVSEAVTA